jgi:hypothetical protein
MPKLINVSKTQEAATNHISSRYSGIQFVDDKTIDPNGSTTPQDKSYTIWQNAWNTFIKLVKGNAHINATNDVNINAVNQVTITGHNYQEVFSGTHGSYIKGEQIHNHGVLTDDQKAKINQFHDYMDGVHAAANAGFNSATPEKVECPNCAQRHLIDDKSDAYNTIFEYAWKWFGNLPFVAFPLAVLQTIINKVYVPLLGEITNLGLNGGKSCGPGCKDGSKEGLANKLTAAENEAQKELERIKDEVNKLTGEISGSSSKAAIQKDSEIYIWGVPRTSKPNSSPYLTHGHHNLPMNLRVSPNHKNKLRVTTEGNCKVVVYRPPYPSPHGNLFLNVQNNLKLVAGDSGIDILCSGEIAMKGGSAHINASQGEASLTSGNLTTIGGKNVLISADDRSGDSGVCIDSKYTYVRGAFNVNGDSAMLGGLTIDGPLSFTCLNGPTMDTPSDLKGDSKFVSHGANWSYLGLALNALNLEKDLLSKFLLQPSLLFTGSGLTELIMEAYNIIHMALPIEPEPTGVAVGFIFSSVFNFPHNHTKPPHDHTHNTTTAKMNAYQRLDGAGMQRVAGNPSPSPAPTGGTFTSPGSRGIPGGCGGGGLFKKFRNQKYGINDDDAFNGGNFVTTTVTRTPDGQITPVPDLTIRQIWDCGSGNTVNALSGTVTDLNGNILGNFGKEPISNSGNNNTGNSTVSQTISSNLGAGAGNGGSGTGTGTGGTGTGTGGTGTGTGGTGTGTGTGTGGNINCID